MQIGLGIHLNLSKMKRYLPFMTKLSDDFGRTNATSLSVADSGQTWQYTGSNWRTELGKALCFDTSNTNTLAYVDMGIGGNHYFEGDITFGTNEGLAVRMSDWRNYITVRFNATSIGAFRFVDNNPTSLGSYGFGVVVGQTYRLRISCNGTTIRVYLDGVERITISNETFNQNAGAVALRAVSSNLATTGRFDRVRGDAA